MMRLDDANLAACPAANMLSASAQKLARVREGDVDRYPDHFREHAPDRPIISVIQHHLRPPGVSAI